MQPDRSKTLPSRGTAGMSSGAMHRRQTEALRERFKRTQSQIKAPREQSPSTTQGARRASQVLQLNTNAFAFSNHKWIGVLNTCSVTRVCALSKPQSIKTAWGFALNTCCAHYFEPLKRQPSRQIAAWCLWYVLIPRSNNTRNGHEFLCWTFINWLWHDKVQN